MYAETRQCGLVRGADGKGLAHLLERGLGHTSDLLPGEGVEHRDGALCAATGADRAACDAHGIELVVKDELVDHGVPAWGMRGARLRGGHCA